MGAFGGEKPKPLSLWGTWPLLDSFRRTGAPIRRLASRDQQWVNGKAKAMAQSAAYTDNFGEMVASLMIRQDKETSRSQQTRLSDCVDGKRVPEPNATWQEIVKLVDAMVQMVPGYPHLDLFAVGQRLQEPQFGLIKRPRFHPKGIPADAKEEAILGEDQGIIGR